MAPTFESELSDTLTLDIDEVAEMERDEMVHHLRNLGTKADSKWNTEYLRTRLIREIDKAVAKQESIEKAKLEATTSDSKVDPAISAMIAHLFPDH